MTNRVPLAARWQFRQLTPRKTAWLPAQVPGCVHTDLLRAKQIPDPFWGDNERGLQWIEEADWLYRAEFTFPPALRTRKHLELVFEGLDTLATIRLNGREIGRSESMFIPLRFEIAGRTKPGANVLEVEFHNPMAYIRPRQAAVKDFFPEWNDPVSGSSVIRKEQCSFGWDWGPRFATCGIYLPAYLEAWDDNRIESVRVTQRHRNGRVALELLPATAATGGEFRGTISLGGKTVATFAGLRVEIPDPQLWWPNGHGAQPLYEVRMELVVNGTVADTWERRVGLRTIELDRHADEFGESFQFVVNGRPIFAKGANWIPAHSFVTEVDRAMYDDILTSAAEANMNMLRVWGGGIYEREDFYDLCDEKGLLVWQDFMFACALYPGTPEFLALVTTEAAAQVKRLAHRACLALWCGNNEIEQMPDEILKTPARKRAYEEIFYQRLPHVVAEFDGVTPYWPCSPHNPEGWEKGFNNERAGDCHFWDVWHARKPVTLYEEKNFRFCSEFGMQSYSSPEVAATYCRPEDFNVFGPEMENHQKNSGGNGTILDYVSRLYRFPRDFAALSYLSQLNQAYCMKVGVEHFRRSMPRTMGALYWQINDCWPVASWSSLEFGGRWKALHYEARRFFAPALISAHVPGRETAGKGNYVTSTIHDVDLYTVFDGVDDGPAVIAWTLYHLKDGVVRKGRKNVTLRYGESVRQIQLDFAADMKRHGARNLVLRVELQRGREVVSRQTVFLTAPRYLDLPRGRTDARLRKLGAGRFELTLVSKVVQHAVAFHLRETTYRADDNYLDLFPSEARHVSIQTVADVTLRALQQRLEVFSLHDSY
jgi:beta-mannosidase